MAICGLLPFVPGLVPGRGAKCAGERCPPVNRGVAALPQAQAPRSAPTAAASRAAIQATAAIARVAVLADLDRPHRPRGHDGAARVGLDDGRHAQAVRRAPR